jgi:site-specific recombinase XerD
MDTVNGREHLDIPLKKTTSNSMTYLNQDEVKALLAAPSTRHRLGLRDRAPHTLRHTTALHLLQSGAELNVIKSWLGHVSITTTSEYIEIDMAMKRKAIERCPPLVPDPEGETRWHASKDIIQWLEDL